MVRANRESAVKRSSALQVAGIVAISAALLLAGCGRRGQLDLPPSAAATPQQATQEQPRVLTQAPDDDAPARVVGQKRRLPIDVLID